MTEDRIRALEAQIEAYKMLADKALSMAMDALVEVRAMKATTHTVQYVNPFDEVKPEKVEQEVIKDIRMSPFNFNGKIITEKVQTELSGREAYEDFIGE